MQSTSPIWKWLWNEGGKNLPPSEYEGDIVSFDNPGYTYPKDITIAIEPVQSGSGDPSPTNVRPISGWTGANVVVSNVAPNADKTITIEPIQQGTGDPSPTNVRPILPGLTFQRDDETTLVVYGGMLDVTTGLLTVDRVMDEFDGSSDEGWRRYGASSASLFDMFVPREHFHESSNEHIKANYLKTIPQPVTWGNYDNWISANTSTGFVTGIKSITDVDSWKAYLSQNPLQICYKLATPQTYQLTPTEVTRALSALNNAVYPIAFPSEAGTVYGGTLDVTTGLLTVDRGMVDLGTLNWRRNGQRSQFYSDPIANAVTDYSGRNVICSCYTGGNAYTQYVNYRICIGESIHRVFVTDDRYTDGIALKNALSGTQLVYELATPQTYQLTPTEVKLLLGDNNVWADTGDMTVALVSAGYTRLEARATIDGTVYTDISAPVIHRAAMPNALSIGNVAAASLSLVIRGAGNIPRSAAVVVEARLNDGQTASEWLPQGTFYISRRARDPVTGQLALECYDALLKAQAVVTELPWTTRDGALITTAGGERIMFRAAPAGDMESLAKDMALLLGLEIDPRSVIQTGAPYEITSPDEGATIRDILSIIAQANGGNWIVTPRNRLRLVPVEDVSGAAEATEDAVDVDGVTGGIRLSTAADITGIRGTVENDAWLIGDDTGIVLEVSLAPVIATEMAEAMLGRRYQAYSLSGAVCDPAAELGDFVRAGVHGEIASALYDQQITLGPACRCDMGAPGGGEITDEYPYIGTGAKTLTLAKAYAREVSAGAVEQLNHALTQQEIFNRLTDNGETQGLILYNGKLYLNAEYIQAGTLVANLLLASILSIGGADNGNGGLRILDGDGNVIGTWNKNGITVSKGSITGGTINGAILTLGGSDNTSGTLTVKDGSGNTVATIDNAGVSVSKGNIAGPTVSLGGVNNQSGVLRIYDILGNEFGVFNNSGLALTTSPVGRPTIRVTKTSSHGNETVTIGENSAVLDIDIDLNSAFVDRHITFDSSGMTMDNGDGETARLDIDRLNLTSGDNLSAPAIMLTDTGENTRVRLSADSGLVFFNGNTSETSIGEADAYFAGPIRFGDPAATRTNLGVTPANIGAVSIDGNDTKDGNLTLNGDLTVNADFYINLLSDATITIGDDYSKIVKDANGNVTMQSYGGASVTVTDGGNVEIQSDSGEASITLDANGDIEVTGVVKDKRILQAASAVSIPSVGNTATVNITGLTDGHQLVRWNFSDSPENIPPADLEWETWDGYFTVTNNGGTTSESITPVFILPE